MPFYKEMSFEDAMKRLEEIVEGMENQDIPLEESLSLYREGAQCARFCRQKLEQARHEVEIWQAGQAEPIDEESLEDERP